MAKWQKKKKKVQKEGSTDYESKTQDVIRNAISQELKLRHYSKANRKLLPQSVT